jgi:hypothetical protein
VVDDDCNNRQPLTFYCMLRASVYTSILLFAGTVLMFGTQAPVQTQKSASVPHKRRPQANAKPQLSQSQTQPSATPPQEVTPEHGPASPPQVSFQNGKLTILARNSTMGDVLNAVREKTGASIDTPPLSGDRVVGQFGPGAPRDVMAQLLNGSHYDYVLLGSPADPGALQKIVLMTKTNLPESQPAPPPANQQVTEQNLPAVPEVESENPNPDENNVEVAPNEPAQEEAQPDQSDQQQQQQGSPVVKTPEQLLRELQQQQQQQQQQNGPPGAPGQPPQ